MPVEDEKLFSKMVDSFTYASAEYRISPELLEVGVVDEVELIEEDVATLDVDVVLCDDSK